MIYSVKANKKGFKLVNFKKGINLILSERTSESSQKDSRNGSGKSLLIEIIDFCLGANFNKKSKLSHDTLKDWIFTLELGLLDMKIAVTRSIKDHNHIDWQILGKDKKYNLPLENPSTIDSWRLFLGEVFFSIKSSESNLSYRTLMSFLIRKGLDAYTEPFSTFKQSNELVKQITNAYFLGLPYEYAFEWQKIEDEKKTLDILKSNNNTGAFKRFIGNRGELEAEIRDKERLIEYTEKQLKSFRVHGQYEDIENKANTLTSQIHGKSNNNIINKRQIEQLNSIINEEMQAEKLDSLEIYKRAKIEVPEMVKKRLDDLKLFHTQLLSNRKSYLQEEINKLNREIKSNTAQISSLTEDRAKLLNILQTHGALREFTKLNEDHTRNVSALEELKIKLQNLTKFEEGLSDIKIQKESLHKKVMLDLAEREKSRKHVMDIFDEYSKFLYEASGHLIINAKDKGGMGYNYKIEIKRSGSEGIEKMKIFCYDLLIARLLAEHKKGPMFLIHDSTLFEGVDERQKGRALQLAEREAKKYGFQYITFFNSDSLPSQEELGQLDIQGITRLTLTDKEDGCLLGLRY
jgi:uncharacterized protein YydD (DUF2326 family)